MWWKQETEWLLRLTAERCVQHKHTNTQTHTRATDEIWSKFVHNVVPKENDFLFIFVSGIEHREASVSAACKWPGRLGLASAGDANAGVERSVECDSDSRWVHTNMNSYLMRWALSFPCLPTNQHVTGFLPRPCRLGSSLSKVWLRDISDFFSHWTVIDSSFVFLALLHEICFPS